MKGTYLLLHMVLEKFKSSTEIIIYSDSPIPSIMFFKVFKVVNSISNLCEITHCFLWCKKKNTVKQRVTLSVRTCAFKVMGILSYKDPDFVLSLNLVLWS